MFSSVTQWIHHLTVEGVLKNVVTEEYHHTQTSINPSRSSTTSLKLYTIKGYQKQEALIILGDFNARVGDDYEAWPYCLGHFGVVKCNDNGQRLLELCSYHELCIINTFFSTKPYHRVSWRHPNSGTS